MGADAAVSNFGAKMPPLHDSQPRPQVLLGVLSGGSGKALGNSRTRVHNPITKHAAILKKIKISKTAGAN